jgi:ABC-type branched-subunit amino acid transport system ATPase component
MQAMATHALSMNGILDSISASSRNQADLLGSVEQAVVLVEQNVKAALAVADRAAVLVEGTERIVARCADLVGDARIAELYLGRHVGAPVAASHTAEGAH